MPRSFSLNSNEILEALQEPLSGIVGAVKVALEQTPPKLGSDVASRGIYLTGGGALLKDIDRLIAEETGLPVISLMIRSPVWPGVAAWFWKCWIKKDSQLFR